MKKHIHNKKYLKPYRKSLRNKGTSAEASLWLLLKNKQLNGRKFRRQHSINNYIVDFYCPEEKLIIELDGAGHFTEKGKLKDLKRDRNLSKLGFKVLRFENKYIFEHQDQALETIIENFKK